MAFRSFVILAGMRTGSNFLEDSLNAFPGLHSHGELFNPIFIGKHNQFAAFGFDLDARAQNPLGLLEQVQAETEGLSGFRLFHDHDPRIIAAVLEDKTCAKILLTRNPAESYVSLKIAQATGQWKLANAKRLREAKAMFDGGEFEDHLAVTQGFGRMVLEALQVTGQSAFLLDYEDIGQIEVLNGLAEWLGIAGRIDALAEGTKKQNPGVLAEKLENPDAAEKALAQMDLFGLMRAPNFEPRQPPMVRHYLAARRVGLLFQPLAGGDNTAIADWLGQVGDGLLDGFTQRSLKDWRQAHPGHRAFTVVRHPVLRAWHVYQTDVLNRGKPMLRQAMVRLLGPSGRQAIAGADAVRDGFLAYLRFAKLNAAGQTDLAPLPQCASQYSLVQGLSPVQPPDMILREDRLKPGLAYLAAEVRATAPAFDPKPDASLDLLGSIHDAEVEKAARDAWPRDYNTLGFGDWTPPA